MTKLTDSMRAPGSPKWNSPPRTSVTEWPVWPRRVTITFAASVGKGSAVDPAFQRQFGGVNLEGARTETLTLTNVQPANAGVYALVITNNIDRSASFTATLTVSGN